MEKLILMLSRLLVVLKLKGVIDNDEYEFITLSITAEELNNRKEQICD